MAVSREGDACCKRVGKWNIDGTTSADHVVIAIRNFCVPFDLIGRLAREEVDGATRCIAAVKRALRSSENFDALKVENVTCRRRIPSDVDTIDMQRDAWIAGTDECFGADPAKRNSRNILTC